MLSPFIAWEAFSFIYYGSFVPNTAVAKLNITTDLFTTVQNGWRYITSTNLYGDFITVPTISAAIFMGVFFIAKKKAKSFLASLSILLYILYIFYIGGDFMVGRHLSAPLFLSVMLLSYSAYDYFNKEKIDPLKIKKAAVLACCVLLFSSALYPVSPITSKLKYEKTASNVFVDVKKRPLDERKYYYKDAGLSYYLANSFVNGYDPERAVYSLGRRGRYMDENTVQVEGSVGFVAYFAPARTVFIDYFGLSDALLARIPAAPDQRVGHYERPIPEGYKESLEAGTNLVENPALKEYYDKIMIMTQGKIFTKERFDTIIKMNLGEYDYLIDEYMDSDEYRRYLTEISDK